MSLRHFRHSEYIIMCDLESFNIDLRRLGTDNATFVYDLDNSYFEAMEPAEITGGKMRATVVIRETSSGCYDVQMTSEGSVIVPCTTCLDDMELPVAADGRLLVRLGEEYSEDDDVIVIDEEEGILDLSWHIYESIALNIPIKHVHAPGKCNAAMMSVLEEYSATRSSDGVSETPVDPRWSELEKLKTIIKD